MCSIKRLIAVRIGLAWAFTKGFSVTYCLLVGLDFVSQLRLAYSCIFGWEGELSGGCLEEVDCFDTWA
jgi:hypothetical protein